MRARHCLMCARVVRTSRAFVLFFSLILSVHGACDDWCQWADASSCGNEDCCDCRFAEGLSCLEGTCPPLPVPSTTGMIVGGVNALYDALPTRRSGQALSIAVVGSSGNVLFHRYGASINAKSIVIRVNHAYTTGYEADVGDWYPDRTSGLLRVGWAEGLRLAVRLEIDHVLHTDPVPTEHTSCADPPALVCSTAE